MMMIMITMMMIIAACVIDSFKLLSFMLELRQKLRLSFYFWCNYELDELTDCRERRRVDCMT